jgi:sigma-B regulation protein RsbU (phosphoserine phosphatase)
MGTGLLKIMQTVKNRLLWKIKHRLILVNIFIGGIPVLMVLAISWYAGLLFYYQFSNYLVENQIKIHSAQIRAFSLSLRDRLQERASQVASPAAVLKETLDSDARFLLISYPTAVRMQTLVNQDRSAGTIENYRVPDWVGESAFNDLVVEDLQPQDYEHRLFIRSLVSSDFMSNVEFTLEVSVPFDHFFLSRLKAALGQDVLLAEQVKIPDLKLMLQNIDVSRKNIVDSTFDTEGVPASSLSGWVLPLFPRSWADGEIKDSFDLGVLLVEPSAAKLLENIYHSESYVGRRILIVLLVMVIVFLIVEILSIFIGIRLTRSITNAVQNLDRGTEYIKQGDFGHRINVQSEDQLGSLAASFNQMTDYMQQLIRERVLKERMERELEIAKEVQGQLFPRHEPDTPRLDVSGVCLPARVVSGDYFDYVSVADHVLGLAVGDICGKGISAALLMANLQASLRSNVMNFQFNGDRRQENFASDIVERINRQLYGNTAENKFATLFFGAFNDADLSLTYCNAGHNPPLYFERDIIQEFQVGGTVLGVFPDSRYEQEKVQLKEGGILVIYTDGIVESANEHGEEFGKDRVVELVKRHSLRNAEAIKSSIIDEVLSWSSAEERGDDMTLIVAKVSG